MPSSAASRHLSACPPTAKKQEANPSVGQEIASGREAWRGACERAPALKVRGVTERGESVRCPDLAVRLNLHLDAYLHAWELESLLGSSRKGPRVLQCSGVRSTFDEKGRLKIDSLVQSSTPS